MQAIILLLAMKTSDEELLKLVDAMFKEIENNLNKAPTLIVDKPWPIWKEILLRIGVGIPLFGLGYLCLKLFL